MEREDKKDSFLTSCKQGLCSAFLQCNSGLFAFSTSAQLVKAFTTGVNSDLPTLPSFRGKMSLSLSNSVNFALIPLAKMGKIAKIPFFLF